MRNLTRKRLLSASMLSGIAAIAATSTAAFAQDADTDDVVIVTGTRLMTNPNLSSANPVLSVTDAEVDVRGAVRIEDFVNILPQIAAGQTTEVSNGATGTAQLDLRGLGPIRTLVLIDGRRLPYGDSSTSSPNLDLIPTQLVERVDILTGGASAVYGSDAIAGVANFVLKRDFEGIELDVLGGVNQAGNGDDFLNSIAAAASQPVADGIWDGESLNLALTMGANTADGRGNVTLFASYETVEAITQDNRSVSACAMGQSSGATSSGGFGCVGSGNFRLFGGDGGDAFQQEDGTIVTYAGGPAQTYNFGPLNFFQRPSERFQVYARGHYELSDTVEAFADLGYVQNNSDAQIAPTASFGAWTLNCDNPLLSGTPGLDLATDILECTAGEIASGATKPFITASHRNVEGGPRNSNLDNDALRIVTGLRGETGNWNWETFFQYSKTSDTDIATNDFIIANVQNALLIEDDGMGGLQCQNAAARAAGCVPYNIFTRGPGGESLVTQAALNYIQGIGITTGETDQIIAGGNVQTDLGNYGWSLPWTDLGVGFLAGIEWRKDGLNAVPDQISQIPGGGFTGVGGATLPVSGTLQALELYTEMQVPIITGRTGFEELTFNGQYRFSDYEANGNGSTNNFNTHAFGLQLNWKPVEDVRLRGQFQRAVRAPNVIELFTGTDTGLPDLNPAGTVGGIQYFDPCSGPAPIATLAACMNTGVTAAQYGSISDVLAGQTQSITGGNTSLRPEKSDTWTGGILYTPSSVPGLSLSVDYFNISIEDYISAGISAQTTLDNCLATGDPQFCSLITRGPGGTLRSGIVTTSGFNQRNINIASLSTSGLDLQARYSMDLADVTGGSDWGSISFDYAATYLMTKDFVPFPGGAPVECAGMMGNACKDTSVAVNPTYRHRLLTTWSTPANIDLAVTWRFLSAVDNINASDTLETGFDAFNYIDLAANIQVSDNVNVRAGVNNLLDNGAPLFTSSGTGTGNGNTFPGTYDIGRFMFVGLNLKF